VALVASVAAEVETVMVFANSDMSDALVARLEAAAGAGAFQLIAPGGNLGLGIAYNAFMEEAQIRAVDFLLLLDQDSTPAPHMISRLAAQYRALALMGENPVLVGPQPVDGAGKPMKVPLLRAISMAGTAGAVPVQFAISSGSLLRLDSALAIGPFRADFFIDAIDLEWCMRARAQGYSVWIARNVLMPHCLGRGLIRLPGGLLLTDQPPRRLYTYLRNQLAMMRLGHVPLSHKLKLIASLPVRLAGYLQHNRYSPDSRRALINGLVDGALNRLGPPNRALRPLWRKQKRG
jgi:rhamnosyltransferase